MNIINKWIKYLYIIFIVILILLIFIFIKGNIATINKTISNVSFIDFLVLSILTIITVMLNGNRIKILSRYFKIKLKFSEWFGLSVTTTMSNYLMPFGLGTSLRGIYLKKKHNLSYKSFIATLGTSYITSFLIYGLLGIIILLFCYIKYNFFNYLIFSIFSIMLILDIIIILISPKINYTKYKFLNYFIETINNWGLMKKDWRLLTKLALNDFFVLIVYSLRIYFIFYVLSNSIPFTFAILIGLITIVSIIVGLTPAAIGIKEALIIYSTAIIGKNLNVGIGVALIDRGVALIYVFILGVIYSYVLIKKLREKSHNL